MCFKKHLLDGEIKNVMTHCGWRWCLCACVVVYMKMEVGVNRGEEVGGADDIISSYSKGPHTKHTRSHAVAHTHTL